jgi:hypothetical protein
MEFHMTKIIFITLNTIILSLQYTNSKLLEEAKILETDWPCDLNKSLVISEFKSKILINPTPKFNSNPYLNQNEELKEKINKTLLNKEIVCAIKYLDLNRKEYEIKNFESKNLAEENGFTVTHQGKCGACSNLNDLAVYLSGDLTSPVRKCGILSLLSNNLSLKCLLQLGFTETCSQIWLYNAINTRQNCFWICIYSWIKKEPFADIDGRLNRCISCDEDISGPIFKYFSGRSRRNSGIESEIRRPGEQIYNLTHCYY